MVLDLDNTLADRERAFLAWAQAKARYSEGGPQPDLYLPAGFMVRLGTVGHESKAVVEGDGTRVGGEDPQRDLMPAVLADIVKCGGK